MINIPVIAKNSFTIIGNTSLVNNKSKQNLFIPSYVRTDIFLHQILQTYANRRMTRKLKIVFLICQNVHCCRVQFISAVFYDYFTPASPLWINSKFCQQHKLEGSIINLSLKMIFFSFLIFLTTYCEFSSRSLSQCGVIISLVKLNLCTMPPLGGVTEEHPNMLANLDLQLGVGLDFNVKFTVVIYLSSYKNLFNSTISFL